MVIAQISDLHYGTDVPAPAAALASALRELEPDLLIVSGDLTQRARRRQFRAARAFLDAQAAPWLAVPGNHDVPLWDVGRRVLCPLGRFRREITDVRAPTAALPGVRVLGLDTTRRKVSGWVRDESLPLIEALADGDPADWRILVTHHPLTRKPPRNHHAALAAAERAGVDVLLAGHFHRTVVAETAWGAVSLEAATPMSDRASPREHPPWAFNVLRLARETLTVERWASGGGPFVPESTRTFTRRNAVASRL